MQTTHQLLELDEIEAMIARAEALVVAARTLTPDERLQKLAEAKRLEQQARAALVAWYTRRLLARVAQ